MKLVHTIYEPGGPGPHPTIIAFHGWGASALDLLGVAPYLGDGRWLGEIAALSYIDVYVL